MTTNYVGMRASEVLDKATQVPSQRPMRQHTAEPAPAPAVTRTMADLSPAQLAYLKKRKQGLIIIAVTLAVAVVSIIVVLLTVG